MFKQLLLGSLMASVGFAQTTTQASNATFICGSKTLSSGNDIEISILFDSSSSYVTIELTGPADSYFAVGFGDTEMDGTYTMVVDSDGDVTERVLDGHTSGDALTTTVSSGSASVNDLRVVVLTRTMAGSDSDYYTFDDTDSNVKVIWATKSSCDSLCEHSSSGRGSATISYEEVDSRSDCSVAASAAPATISFNKAGHFGFVLAAILAAVAMAM